MLKPKSQSIGLLLLGFLAGISGSALGIGGGVIIVPALALLFSFDFKKSVALSLSTIIPAALIGSLSYLLWDLTTGTDNILLSVAAITAVGAVMGSFAGVKIAHITHDRWLKIIFALLLIITSLKLLNIIQVPTTKLQDSPWGYLLLLGLFAGFSSGLLGIGGGVIIVPILTLFFVDSIHQAIPTSLLIIVPTTIAGAIFHRKIKALDFTPLKFLVPAAMIGAIIGVFIKNNLPEEHLKLIFSIFLIISSAKLLLSSHK